ncbi:5-formyltetrahydrofolate cyclo-ligase [Kineosporia sp. NBRC 101677]|uniref:5-formyltetrahydrofolate cyclo-ligase n=1 Tax=Kineosporia sp. NBRC 101677 TaxID=3032197 RepID=UPI0024A1C85F|nr:5-formyltetrahydrofolate cyclo-ligase [Kineosporia sp. NBRC 101677]GLY14510.1 5-formyltetrahydrofolate cyclo-ligase [Kineosporia sp. NBRC 101677]
MDGPITSGGDKGTLRRTVRRSRAARSPQERQQTEIAVAAAALEVEAVRTASCVAVYASLPDEPGTGELRRRLRALGVRVLLPVVLETTTRPTLDWAVDAGGLAPTGVLKLLEPTGERLGPDAVTQADVLLIPALAVDTTGLRLGRGRGYYDATLARLNPRTPVFAVVHDDELVAEVPAEPHDRRVHGVLTPTRTVFFSSPA